MGPLFLIAAAVARPTAAELADAVVLLHQGPAVCAGALVDADGTVATAYHCVARGGRPRALARDGAVGRGRVVAVDRGEDLALVRVDAFAGRAFLTTGPPPSLGARVLAIGHPYASGASVGYLGGLLRWTVSDGVVSAVGPRALQISAPVNPGSSGGPVIDAESGALVAVVSRRLGEDGIGFATLASALEGARPGFSPLGGTVELGLGVSLWGGSDAAIALAGRLDLVARGRVALGVDLALPISARWDAARFGAATWVEGATRLGLRQPFGRGPWAGYVEARGGLARVASLVEDERIVFRREVREAPLAGIAVAVGGVAVEVDRVWTVDGGGVRTGVSWGWPGTMAYW